uniref:ZP domain-containing protein n=1 Tax=Gongylonema pulchrum TaxID=637853 RepID=A0A183DK31_9BILA
LIAFIFLCSILCGLVNWKRHRATIHCATSSNVKQEQLIIGNLKAPVTVDYDVEADCGTSS